MARNSLWDLVSVGLEDRSLLEKLISDREINSIIGEGQEPDEKRYYALGALVLSKLPDFDGIDFKAVQKGDITSLQTFYGERSPRKRIITEHVREVGKRFYAEKEKYHRNRRLITVGTIGGIVLVPSLGAGIYYQTRPDHPLVQIANIESDFLEFNRKQRKEYVRSMENLREFLVSASEKADTSHDILLSMYRALGERFVISEKKAAGSFMIHASLYRKSFDCDQVAMSIGATAKEDCGIEIYPAFLVPINGRVGHVILRYNSNGIQNFDPLYGRKISIAELAEIVEIPKEYIFQFDLKSEGFMILAYNQIGTYFHIWHQKSGRTDYAAKAIQAFSKMIELDESCPMGYCQRAATFDNMGQSQKALRDYERAYSGFPSPNVLISIGSTYERLGHYKRALDCFDKVLELCGEHPDLYADTIKRVEHNLTRAKYARPNQIPIQ